MKYKCLAILMILALTISTQAQNPSQNKIVPKTILVLGLKTSQFNSNVYFVNELAVLNDTSQAKVIGLYNQTLLETLVDNSTPEYRFIIPSEAEIFRILVRSNYVEWKNEYKEPYLAIDADSVQDMLFTNLIQKYQASYVLNLNYYTIFKNSPPAFYKNILKTRHIIDYEIFTNNLSIASAGQITLVSNNSRAIAMKTKYADLTSQFIQRLKIFEGNFPPAIAEKKYMRLKEQNLTNAWGGGFSLGWGSAYGWLGTELTHNIGTQWDVNFGVGFGPSGFKAGAGARYYLLNYGRRYRPFFGINYAWASGMEISMGGEKDQSGTQLYPEKVTDFKIPSGHAIHLKTGFRWLKNHKAWMLHLGYGIPFNDTNAKVLSSGNDVDASTFTRRKNLADLFTVGGVDAGITYIIYFSR